VPEAQWSPSLCQFLFCTLPDVARMFLAQRAKGRLDKALRDSDLSPKEVASMFLNGLVPYNRGNCMWRETYYAGSFGIYALKGFVKGSASQRTCQGNQGASTGRRETDSPNDARSMGSFIGHLSSRFGKSRIGLTFLAKWPPSSVIACE